MSYEVKPGNLFGRVGQGIGQGLAAQVPKEIDRYRLSQGLKDLEARSGDLTPLQVLTGAASIPGITPQMIESFGDLARQQARSQALIQGANKTPENPFKRETRTDEKTGEEVAPSLTTRTPIEETLKPKIPKSLKQLQDRAGQLYQENPALYKSDPQLAMNAAIQEDQQEQAISTAIQGQRTKEQNVQDTVQQTLKNQQKSLGAQVPGNVYSKIENQAINAVKPKPKNENEQGGEGLTEQQAIKKYGDKLDEISREYKAIETVGTGKLIVSSPKDNKSTLRSLQKKFKERDDLENFGDSLISENNLSPSKAYYLAYPVSDNKELNNAITKIPKLKPSLAIPPIPGIPTFAIPRGLSEQEVKKKTLDVSKQLAPVMKRTGGSPLSIAEELKERNYDPYTWMNYLRENQKELDLTGRQGREIDKSTNFVPTTDDLWLFYFSGLDPLVEQ